MISLDQILLLEKKVESAVEKIIRLQSENDALRKKCAELTNAVSAKTEQLSAFETDQSQIENGIKKALDKLNSIENDFLKTADLINQNSFCQVASASNKNVSEQKPQNTIIQSEQKNKLSFENENQKTSVQHNANFNNMTFVNQVAAETQIQTNDYENQREISNNEQNFESELFEKNQNDMNTEENFEQSKRNSDVFDEEPIIDNSSDDDSDDDLGFDIF